MKKISAFVALVTMAALSVLLVEGCKPKAAAPVKISSGAIESAQTTSFKEVTSKLDPGGNVYLYLSTEQWLTNLSGRINSFHDAVASLPNVQDQKQQIDDAFTIGTGLIKDSGLEDVSGIGMSSVEREKGTFYNKLIVHHYSGQGNGFLWTVFGKEPHALSGLDLLPANTAMAAFYDLDAAQVWAIIQKAIEQSSFPQAKDSLKTFSQQFEKNSGMKWDDVINSLDGEIGFIVTLDDSKMTTIPMSQPPMEIPEPSIMLVVKVKNDAIFNRIDDSMKKSRQHPVSVNESGLKMRTMPIPFMPPWLRPSVASGGGYLFIATSDAAVKEVLAVKGGKAAGLKSTEEFKNLSADIPEQGNQFCFLSKRFGQTVVKIQQQALASNKQMPAQIKSLVQSFAQPDKAAFTYAVGANTDEGWMMVANGNQSSANLLAASAVVPAILAGIAVPNFVRARETAQKNTCINNLRMIEGAKQQWALEKTKTASDIPTWDDLKPYMGRGRGTTLRCPQGGNYNLGAVGEMPTCSIPGHMLPTN